MTAYNTRFHAYIEDIQRALADCLPAQDSLQGEVVRAMAYSLQGGGKRIRPVLTLEFCRACGGDIRAAMPFACAVEMVHSYSLIHDDLPCMDNDDYRRGRPSCHVAFGEATALLAGDALLNLAMETILTCADQSLLAPSVILRAAAVLFGCSGTGGMIGGQVIDLANEGKPVSEPVLAQTHRLKTGALIRAACVMGAVARRGRGVRARSRALCRKPGTGVPIVDDILTLRAMRRCLAKTGSDAANNKTTYVTLYGLEASREMAKALTERAVESVRGLPMADAFLPDLARSLSQRVK
ncbi:MAG: polyprenyl synthetase family protein [Oscillospiraceae bacterium]